MNKEAQIQAFPQDIGIFIFPGLIFAYPQKIKGLRAEEMALSLEELAFPM